VRYCCYGRCGEWFTPRSPALGGHMQKYCSRVCRFRASQERQELRYPGRKRLLNRERAKDPNAVRLNRMRYLLKDPWKRREQHIIRQQRYRLRQRDVNQQMGEH